MKILSEEWSCTLKEALSYMESKHKGSVNEEVAPSHSNEVNYVSWKKSPRHYGIVAEWERLNRRNGTLTIYLDELK